MAYHRYFRIRITNGNDIDEAGMVIASSAGAALSKAMRAVSIRHYDSRDINITDKLEIEIRRVTPCVGRKEKLLCL